MLRSWRRILDGFLAHQLRRAIRSWVMGTRSDSGPGVKGVAFWRRASSRGLVQMQASCIDC